MSAYPHPVLTSNTDDIDGDTRFQYEFINDVLYVKGITVNNSYIKKLIQDGDATFCLILENNSVMFNYTVKSSDFDISLSIDKDFFPNGRYSAELLITLNKNIHSYASDTFHRDYDGINFDLDAGTVIGNLGYFDFTVRKNYHEIGQKDDIFQWAGRDEPELKGSFRNWIQQGKIYIGYHEEDRLSIIQKLQDHSQYAVIQGYIIPTLVWALEKIRHEYRECANELWAISIINRMIKKGFIDNGDEDEVVSSIENETSANIANQIIELPLVGLKNKL